MPCPPDLPWKPERQTGDDQDLRLLVELAEVLADLPLLVRVEMEFLQQGGAVVVLGDLQVEIACKFRASSNNRPGIIRL
jgi:hypothetical protein